MAVDSSPSAGATTTRRAKSSAALPHQRALRVLHVSQPASHGIARGLAQLALAQLERGWGVTVAVPPGDELDDELHPSVARRPWAATRAPGPQVALETARLAAIVDAVDPDVVHLHSAKAGLAGRLAVRGRRPTVFQPNAWSFQVPGVQGRAAAAWERRAQRWTDLTVCVSEDERQEGLGVGLDGPTVVVPNAVAVGGFEVADDAGRSAAKVALGLPAGPLVVCPARLCHQKGQDLLLDLWPRVLSACPSATLALVGDGPLRAELEARRAPGVTFAGHRTDVPRWLAAADVVAMPSRYEGHSFALLEALASGRPVVAFATTGMAETLRAGTATAAGAVVPQGEGDVFAAAVAIRLLAPELAAAEGRAGRLRSHAFDVGPWAERLCELTAAAATSTVDLR